MPNVEDTMIDPLVSFSYGLEIEGKVTGYFTEVSGLGSENEIVEHKVTNEQGQEIIKKVPGRIKFQDIVLKRGITEEMDIWEWRKEVEDGNVDDARTNGSIVMYDQSLQESARWNFERAWPLKVTGPSLKSDSNEIGIEELTIVHEFLERVS